MQVVVKQGLTGPRVRNTGGIFRAHLLLTFFGYLMLHHKAPTDG